MKAKQQGKQWYSISEQDCNTAMVELSNRPGVFALVDTSMVEALGMHNKTWGINGRGYVRFHSHILGRVVELQQLVLYVGYGILSNRDFHAHHINYDPLDNRSHNIKLSTAGDNMRDRNKAGKSSTYPGVSFNKKSCKWEANCMVKRTRKYLGMFESELSAALAYKSYRLEQQI